MINYLLNAVWGPRREPYKPDMPEIARCNHCVKLISNRMCNRMVTHLIAEHRLADEHAYQTVDEVFLRFNRYLKSRP